MVVTIEVPHAVVQHEGERVKFILPVDKTGGTRLRRGERVRIKTMAAKWHATVVEVAEDRDMLAYTFSVGAVDESCECHTQALACRDPNYNSDGWCGCGHWESCHKVPERAVREQRAREEEVRLLRAFYHAVDRTGRLHMTNEAMSALLAQSFEASRLRALYREHGWLLKEAER